MRKLIPILGVLALMLLSVVSAYPTYLDIAIAETVNQNTTFAEDFDLVEQTKYCDIIGTINVTNPNETLTVSDILLNFTETGAMQTNFTYLSGRTGAQQGNSTPGEEWFLHIPELAAGESSVWTYNISCSTAPPPVNISTSYATTVSGVDKKVLAGKNFTITQFAQNDLTSGAISNVNITIEALAVVWNASDPNAYDIFNLTYLLAEGDAANVTQKNDTYWEWIVGGGTIPYAGEFNISYVVKAPASVPSSNTYLAIRERSQYSIPILASNLTLQKIDAIADIEFSLEKTIIRPATNVNDTNVTWQVDTNLSVPYNIGFNLTFVSLWVTHNLSPLATDTPFGALGRNYTPNSIINQSVGWATKGSSYEFNYTDGSNGQSPPPIVWVRPYFSLFGGNQILSSNVTQSGADFYMKYIYVVNGYWLEVDKNITSQGAGQYDINVTVRNIGNAWTPSGLTVTVYDFIPAEFSPFAWNPLANANQTVEGPGFNGTAFQWDLGVHGPYNASLGPPGSGNDTWSATYSVNGTGQYKASELYIVGLDPRQVEGAGSHEGITIIAGMSSSTKEFLYIFGVVALVVLNIVNFIMTRNIHQRLSK
ncbi:hypothetical protein H6504_00840 [Candidatus Woesearchaeota archaeon]|nr:hypothetical protein [Candidatus Woesearchaeota archaeon]